MWGKHKYTHPMNWKETVVVEQCTKEVKLVSVSDIAFALLILENYMEKWEQRFEVKKQRKVWKEKV